MTKIHAMPITIIVGARHAVVVLVLGYSLRVCVLMSRVVRVLLLLMMVLLLKHP